MIDSCGRFDSRGRNKPNIELTPAEWTLKKRTHTSHFTPTAEMIHIAEMLPSVELTLIIELIPQQD